MLNWLDFVVLFSSLLSIAAYGAWRTRKNTGLDSYVKGSEPSPWFVIGLSVMATQASAVTFLSTPGQGYSDGLGFLQIYFGVPLALLIIARSFLPNFRMLNVYTAYEFLQKRFDEKTRLLGATIFLIQRGLGAGLTIYAPAIVLTTVFGWSLDLTIISCGLVVIAYTVFGGSEAVTLTQKYQISLIFAGMIAAAALLVSKLPAGMNLIDTYNLANGFSKLNAVNLSLNPDTRYTLWSGLLGGTFLMLSYFGTDQSQVQRYISGPSLRESQLGLLFNAVCKIPMQLCILSLGVLLFVFYQFNQPPIMFDPTAGRYLEQHRDDQKLLGYQDKFAASRMELRSQLGRWLDFRHQGDQSSADTAFSSALAAQKQSDSIRSEAKEDLAKKMTGATANDADYVFITFIVKELPHGLIGLLIAAFFAATLASKSAELNALGTTTSLDILRSIKKDASAELCLKVARWSTAGWGLLAIAFALFARLAENLIQAVNILGSIFYGVLLGIFVVAFFIKRVGGTAIFWSALVTQVLIFVLYFNLTISYLWYPLIGCAICVAFSLLVQTALKSNPKAA